MSERLACKAVGLARSTYRNLPMAQTPALSLTKSASVTDANGNSHMTIEGPIQWLVNPQYPNSAKMCIGTFTASQVLF